MSKPQEAGRSSSSSASPPSPSPASVSASASASTNVTTTATAHAAQPPKAHPPAPPPPPPGSDANRKGPPPNAILIKVSKSLTADPSSGLNTGSAAATPSALVSVPAQCWYANLFTLSTNTPMSQFHQSMRGKVFFSPRAVPVSTSELLLIPGEKPPQLTVCEIGKDLLYGVGYLYNTPLSVEHQWRGRVAHLLRVRSHQAPIPSIVLRRAEALAALQRQRQEEENRKDSKSKKKLKQPSSATPSASSRSPPVTIDYFRTMSYERGEASVYDRPADDLLIGIKLYVNDVLVEDHYPIVNALPQCTTTLAVTEATRHWNCVPFVLMGYLNQQMLDPICIYHSLSLNFVEYLLRVKITEKEPSAKPVTPPATPPAPSSENSAAKKKSPASVDLKLRVEIVYGCRAEAYYCTDFISRGTCTLRVSESSKRALKNYEEKLRALVRLRRAAPQLILRDSSSGNSGGGGGNDGGSPPPQPPRNCSGCGYPLQYRCTICGANVCGTPTCVKNAVIGYPRACTQHALQPDQQN